MTTTILESKKLFDYLFTVLHSRMDGITNFLVEERSKAVIKD